MPGIKRAQRNYSSVGVVDVTEPEVNVRPSPRFCIRCREMFGVYHLLGPRIMPIDKSTGQAIPKPADYDNWLECYGCGTVYATHEVKQEAQLSSITEADDNPFDRTRGVIIPVRESRKFDKTGRTQAKKKRKQELEHKDPDVKLELQRPGTELISYHEESYHS
jgi:hypothetical protein